MSADDRSRKHLARVALAAMLLTFALSRVLVLLIMSRRVPDLYLHVGGTHVHHLNYGIFLLSGVGAYLLFGQPGGARLRAAAVRRRRPAAGHFGFGDGGVHAKSMSQSHSS